MTNLHNKLREILDNVIPRPGEVEGMTEELHEGATTVAIEAIISVFQEEGWYRPQDSIYGPRKRPCSEVHPDLDTDHGGHD